MDTFPRFTAAAVQASPVYLDPDATVQKAVGLIHEAAAAGATLIAFPEVFVPGYPYWNWTMNGQGRGVVRTALPGSHRHSWSASGHPPCRCGSHQNHGCDRCQRTRPT